MPAPFFEQANNNNIASMLRVNHAGEYAAKKIYEGQLLINKNSNYQQVLFEMLMNEDEHLAFFTRELIDRDIRPTMFIGLWQYVAYYLGVISAFWGIKEAMLLTVGVEETIEQHYLHQLNALNKITTESKLRDRIHRFMLEEVEHSSIAEQYLPEYSKIMQIKKQLISFGCKLAIYLSKKF